MTGPSLALLFILVSQHTAGTRPVDFSSAVTRVPLAAASTYATPQSAARTTTNAAESEYFFTWGYNGAAYARSDMHFSQPSLGNDFTLSSVQARDSKSWDLWNHALTVPQYNFRFGFFRGKWGFELALDHMKWIVRQDQQVHVAGTLGGAAVDGQLTLTEETLKYQLNNGANPVFFNLVRRVQIAGQPGRAFSTVLLAKAGGGFAMPHTENVVFGQKNDKGFQFFHGWDVDAAAAIRVNLFKRFYFELEDKLVYASYHGVKIDQGKARHNVRANEYSWTFGLAFK